MINSLIYLIIIGFILGLLFWLIDWLGVPAPINKVLKAVVILVGVIMLINFLLQLTGQPGFIRFHQ